MELNHLKYFYEVARSGSFTKAAKVLRVSQPSISKIVKQLETHQNVTLFERGKKGVALTEAGKRVFDSCSVIFNEVTNLRSSIVELREACVGDLSVAASDNLSNHALPDFFFKFWKKYPAVKVHLFSGTSESIKNELRANRAEIGLYYSAGFESELDTERLGFVEFALVCSPQNEKLSRASASKKFDAGHFNEAFYLGSRLADYARPYPALKMLESIGIKPKLFFETNNQETQKRMAVQKYGYTLVPRFMVKEELKSGLLRELKTPKTLGSDLYLAQKKGKTLSKPATAFKGHVRKHLIASLD